LKLSINNKGSAFLNCEGAQLRNIKLLHCHYSKNGKLIIKVVNEIGTKSFLCTET